MLNNQERRLSKTVYKKLFRKTLRRIFKSKKGLAIPVTYMVLFVSLMAIISVTYSFAVVKIGARGALLKASVAKHNMLVLDDAVHSVAWSFGASKVVYMDDCGGVFQMQPSARSLLINFTDEQTFHTVVFNKSIGTASYELQPSEINYDGLFIRGDERTIINNSFTMTQLYVTSGDNAKELVLCYRPSAASAVINANNGKPQNLIRIHILKFESFHSLTCREQFYIKVTSLNVTTIPYQYEFNQSISSLALQAVSDGTLATIWLPISSNAEGAVVNVETVVCHIEIQKAGV